MPKSTEEFIIASCEEMARKVEAFLVERSQKAGEAEQDCMAIIDMVEQCCGWDTASMTIPEMVHRIIVQRDLATNRLRELGEI